MSTESGEDLARMAAAGRVALYEGPGSILGYYDFLDRRRMRKGPVLAIELAA